MITRIVKLSFHPGHVERFFELFNQVSDPISNFKGCHYLEMLHSADQPGIIFTYSIWDNVSSLNTYLESPLFASTWKQVKPLFNARAEAWTLNTVFKRGDL